MLLVCRTKQSIGITTKQLTGSQIGSNPSKKKTFVHPWLLRHVLRHEQASQLPKKCHQHHQAATQKALLQS